MQRDFTATLYKSVAWHDNAARSKGVETSSHLVGKERFQSVTLAEIIQDDIFMDTTTPLEIYQSQH